MGYIHPYDSEGYRIHPTAFIHHTAIVAEHVYVGKNVYIGPYCLIGQPAEWKGKSEHGKGTQGIGVIISENSVLTGHVTVDSAAGVNPTFIGKDCYLMKHSHVGHDAHLMDGVTVSCGAKIGGHAVIGHDVNIGLNAVIHQKCIVREGCMIGACAFIGKTLETKPYRKYAGVPARDIGENIKP